jgi:hypothetical protein
MKGLATSTAKTSLGQAIPAYRFPEKKIFCRAAKRHKKPLPIREIVGKWQHPLRAEFPGPVKSSRIKVIASLAGSFDPRPQISGR